MNDDVRDMPTSSRSKNVWIVLLKDLTDFALHLNKTDNRFGGFEVHKIRIRGAKECDIKQKNGSIRHFAVPRRRIIAGSGEFGKFGWHFPSLDLVFVAHPIFKKYCEEIERRLEDALIVTKTPVSRGYIDKTPKIDSSVAGGMNNEGYC